MNHDHYDHYWYAQRVGDAHGFGMWRPVCAFCGVAGGPPCATKDEAHAWNALQASRREARARRIAPAFEAAGIAS